MMTVRSISFESFLECILHFGEGNALCALVDWMVQRINTVGLFHGHAVVV
jgi:mannitol-1-phosphate/altronate dehydrogenase